jgi:bacillithiol biosynthesis deacetylase BshB1
MFKNYKVDVLAMAAHPDDIELSCGGTIAKLVLDGLRVSIVDFTRGEMGTRGTPEIRVEESMEASKILGIHHRENLGLPDGFLESNEESVRLAVTMIRKYRPEIVLMNPPFERHPDHQAVNQIIRKAMFKSGLLKFETTFEGETQKTHRIRKMFCFQQSYDFPDGSTVFYVNVTKTFKTKMDAIKTYVSQVYVPGKSMEGGPITRLSRPEFLEEIEARAISHGTKIGARYAEAFSTTEPLGIDGLDKLL